MSDRSQDFRDLLVASHDDPLLFCERILRSTPRLWQRKALEAIRARLQARETRLEVLIRACHSAGKSWLVGVIVLWYVTTRPEARGSVLAPKWQTIEEVVFAEIRRLYAGSLLADLGVGRCLMTTFELGPAWFVSGAASDKPETLEGVHSPTAALRVIDEAKAVPADVFTVTQGSLASPESFDAWISTPNLRTGEFYQRDIHGGPRVLRIVVTADNLIAEGIAGIAEWKADCAEKWGVDSATYRSRVMAEYVEEGGGSLYRFSDIERAVAHEWTVGGPPRAGMDCGGSRDGDESVVMLAYGPDRFGRRELRLADAWQEADTMKSVGRALRLLREAGAESAGVDAIGLGQGVADALAMSFPRTAPYRASEAPDDPVMFTNKKGEDAWGVRKMLTDGLLKLPDDSALRSQFLAMRFEITAAGKVRVIDPSNDSPDRHDAAVIALSAQRGSPEFHAVFGGPLIFADDEDAEGRGPGDPLPQTSSFDDVPYSDDAGW